MWGGHPERVRRHSSICILCANDVNSCIEGRIEMMFTRRSISRGKEFFAFLFSRAKCTIFMDHDGRKY